MASCARDSGWCDGRLCEDRGVPCPNSDRRRRARRAAWACAGYALLVAIVAGWSAVVAHTYEYVHGLVGGVLIAALVWAGITSWREAHDG